MADKLEVQARKAIDTVRVQPTTQDAHDILAAELYAADTLRKLILARYNNAKEAFTENFLDDVNNVRGDAAKSMTKATSLIHGVDFTTSLAAATPATVYNMDAMVNALIKAGVDRNIIESCRTEARKINSPALTITVIPNGQR